MRLAHLLSIVALLAGTISGAQEPPSYDIWFPLLNAHDLTSESVFGREDSPLFKSIDGTTENPVWNWDAIKTGEGNTTYYDRTMTQQVWSIKIVNRTDTNLTDASAYIDLTFRHAYDGGRDASGEPIARAGDLIDGSTMWFDSNQQEEFPKGVDRKDHLLRVDEAGNPTPATYEQSGTHISWNAETKSFRVQLPARVSATIIINYLFNVENWPTYEEGGGDTPTENRFAASLQARVVGVAEGVDINIQQLDRIQPRISATASGLDLERSLQLFTNICDGIRAVDITAATGKKTQLTFPRFGECREDYPIYRSHGSFTLVDVINTSTSTDMIKVYVRDPWGAPVGPAEGHLVTLKPYESYRFSPSQFVSSYEPPASIYGYVEIYGKAPAAHAQIYRFSRSGNSHEGRPFNNVASELFNANVRLIDCPDPCGCGVKCF